MAKNKQTSDRSSYAWAALRLSLGFTFLWAFFDKLFGLGFATCRDAKSGAIDVMCGKAWLEGGSPTLGFLKFGTKGPFADFYQSLAGKTAIDWLFMIGLLGIGIALVAGIALKLAAISGSLLMFMMWSAALWPANNPLIDDHIIYIFALWGIYLTRHSARWSLQSWWSKQELPKKIPILR